ncbi:cell division protein ZapC [Photobacterium jeanii]|uniref:Cell division protein ZapC n=1 Tax=Photobacterium jeanii TaxID=858640 RepID=A0A178KMZ5_9GAMM|nr:cell division protein ZapC [Photobacterium jeanii]OAN17932.1 cell division protein ZapC [Photobacterium jeanii]PST92399.1 cell division protein ZapC [Photobacterium jeanii]
MLKPNNSWKWYFDQQHNSLMLDLGNEMVFRVAIPAKLLVTCALEDNTFTVDDASIYQTFKDRIDNLDLPRARKAELALNAVAASRFHKPMMPKSWFFKTQSHGYEPELGEVVTLETETGTSKFIVIENSGSASLCMMAELDTLALNSTKEMKYCDTIKVMNDRIPPFVEELHQGLALVG